MSRNLYPVDEEVSDALAEAAVWGVCVANGYTYTDDSVEPPIARTLDLSTVTRDSSTWPDVPGMVAFYKKYLKKHVHKVYDGAVRLVLENAQIDDFEQL